MKAKRRQHCEQKAARRQRKAESSMEGEGKRWKSCNMKRRACAEIRGDVTSSLKGKHSASSPDQPSLPFKTSFKTSSQPLSNTACKLLVTNKTQSCPSYPAAPDSSPQPTQPQDLIQHLLTTLLPSKTTCKLKAQSQCRVGQLLQLQARDPLIIRPLSNHPASESPSTPPH